MLNRRSFLASSTAAVWLAGTGALRAQVWTSQPVMIINPFSAGSAIDVVARLVADDLTQRLGLPFRVENRTGASGIIGTEAVLQAGADGQTFLLGSSGSMGINPFMLENLPYDAVEDFIPLCHVASFGQAICVSPRLGVTTLEELIELARQRPGQLRFGSSGEGTTSHLAMEMVNAEQGLEMIHVPYQGGSLAIQALIAGEIDLATEGLPSLTGHIESGDVLPIAVTSGDRNLQYTEIPSVSELIPDFDASVWIIFFAPAGTDDAIVQTLSEEIRASANQPSVKARLNEIGATVFSRSQQETTEFHRAELLKWEHAVSLARR